MGYSIETGELFKKTAKEYLSSRKKLNDAADQIPYLAGNDNMVGRIGEFIAYQYLLDIGRKPKKADSKTTKGYDFICDNDKIYVQVKVLTYESKYQQNNRLKEPWHEFILISIDKNLKNIEMGHITKSELQNAIDNPDSKQKSISPQVNKYMLGDNGLFKNYGKIINGSKYL